MTVDFAIGSAAGAVAMFFVMAIWTWWMDVRDDVSWSAFWMPVRDITMHGKPWMGVHLVAHLAGGVAIAGGLLVLGIKNPWFSEMWMRALWIIPFQLLWERIQHENWRRGNSSDYPWWSAVWDMLITYAAWLIVELALVIGRGLLA